jgi:hypothetical protein
MKIYKAEQELGLDFITEASWSHFTISSALDSFKDSGTDKKNAPTLYPNPHLSISPDLLEINAILVTTNWNRNDDVFSPDEVWKAKSTPLYKPANLNHEGKESSPENKIIGVIANCYPVDDDYQTIYSLTSKADEGEDDEEDEEEIQKFHLLVSMFLWQSYFPKAISQLKEKIDSQQMYVSMECIK